MRALALMTAIAWGLLETISPATAYPDRPVTLVAPYAAGGTSDTLARATAQGLREQLGQSVIVENKTGAGGTIGLTAVARSQADGHTIGLGGAGSLVHSAGVYAGRLNFDVKKDFVPIALLATTPVAVAVSPSLGVSNLTELAALARKQPNNISYGSAGVGGALHLGAELFQRLSNTKLVHIPYRGVAPAITDLLGGQIPVVFGDVTGVLPHRDGNRIKIIAVLAAERVPQLPDIPTAAEQGFPDLLVQVWYGLVAPTGTPADVVKKLQGAAEKVASTPQFESIMLNAGFTRFPGDGKAFSDLIDRELKLWVPIIKDANITAQ